MLVWSLVSQTIVANRFLSSFHTDEKEMQEKAEMMAIKCRKAKQKNQQLINNSKWLLQRSIASTVTNHMSNKSANEQKKRRNRRPNELDRSENIKKKPTATSKTNCQFKRIDWVHVMKVEYSHGARAFHLHRRMSRRQWTCAIAVKVVNKWP